jgi:hypothetical protein
MSKIANRPPDQQPALVEVLLGTQMLHGNQLDAVTGGNAYLPAVQKPVRITDGTSNTMVFAE